MFCFAQLLIEYEDTYAGYYKMNMKWIYFALFSFSYPVYQFFTPCLLYKVLKQIPGKGSHPSLWNSLWKNNQPSCAINDT